MTSKAKENFYYIIAAAAIIILFIFVELSLISKGFFSLSADESGHTLEAYEWLRGEGGFFSIWLPLFKILNSFALKIHFDLVATPRIMSAVFGLLTLFALIYLTYKLFDNKIIALFSGFLGTIFLPIAIFSVLPLQEIYFFFLITSSISFLIAWIKSRAKIYLTGSIIFCALATTARYEAWVFACIIFIIMVFRILKSEEHSKKKLIVICSAAIILFSFPVIWIYLSSSLNKEVYGFITSVASRYSRGQILSEIKNNVLYLFLSLNVTSLNIIGIISLASLFKINSSVKIFTIILFGSLVSFAFISFLIKAMPTHNHWRVAAIWCLLLLPFTAHWLFTLLEKIRSDSWNRYAFTVFTCLIIYFFISQLEEYTSNSYFTRSEIDAGNFLRQVSNDDVSKIFILKHASDKWRYSNLEVASQKPELFVSNLKNIKYAASDSLFLPDSLVSEMIDRNIKYIVVPSSIVLGSHPIQVREIKRFEKWNIFLIDR